MNDAKVDQRSFVARRGNAWKHLEQLLLRTRGSGLRRLDASEILELARLYRWVTSDLAFAQAHNFDAPLLAYLNRLTARAHAEVYASAVTSGSARLARFFSIDFPREFRASFPFIGACIALTVIWAGLAYAVVFNDPSNAGVLLPDWLVPAHISKSLHDSNFAFTPDRAAAISSEIITNNVRVAIMTFAGGIVSLGALTIYLIVFNALMLGALAALFAHAGFGTDYWATIAPHGFIELTAIQIAGGAGLLIGAGALFPGRLRRTEAIRRNGRRAAVLMGGVISMLCAAGIVEAFFSPLRFGIAVRAAVGLVTAAALLVYFVASGRTTTDRAA